MEKETLDVVFNVIGTSGVLLILAAYFLMQLGRITSKQLAYSLLNLVGAFLIMVSLLHSWNLPSAIIEICWIAISSYGVYQAVKTKKREKKNG